MIVVLALQQDVAAHALITQWSSYDAHLLTACDLAAAGWQHYVGTHGQSMAVVDGQRIADEAVRAVLTRIPCVLQDELVTIASEERSYVAAEMTAFLLSWLAGLQCPIVNRPTPTCLAGPYWRHEHWVRAAARCGVPIQPVHRKARLGNHPPVPTNSVSGASVTVVGERCLGEVDERLKEHARRLATLANVQLLSVHFASPEGDAMFLGADLWPDVSDAAIANTLLEYLLQASTTRRAVTL